jgi:hypothetical protein
MNAQISLQNLTAPVNFLETLHRCRSASVVTSKIDQRLFALKNCGHGWLSSIRAIRREVCSISAARQSDFHRAGEVALSLSPNESEAFQTSVRLRFAVTIPHALIHLTSSRAQ